MKLPWMPRTERKLWASARTLPDLGEITALWLEGAISSRPGYTPRCGPDPETASLTEVLAACNRAGYVTESSQPGYDGPGYDGAHWEQRAAISGFVSRDNLKLLDTLRYVALRHQCHIIVQPGDAHFEDGMEATLREGEATTVFGTPISEDEVRLMWSGCHRDAVQQAVDAWQVTLLDLEFGDIDLLWLGLTEELITEEDPWW